MIILSYLSGELAAKQIIINKRSFVLIGVITGFIIVITGTIAGSLVGFFQEGIPNSDGNLGEAIFDYILKPLLWVLYFGFIPIIMVGIVFGYLLKRKCG